MRSGVLWLAAALLLALVCIEPAAAGPVRDSSRARALLGKTPKPPKPIVLAAPNSDIRRVDLQISLAYDAQGNVSYVNAGAVAPYCLVDPSIATCQDASASLCQGYFHSVDGCPADAANNYTLCGLALTAPRRQPISPDGGFNVSLDLISLAPSCGTPGRRLKQTLPNDTDLTALTPPDVIVTSFTPSDVPEEPPTVVTALPPPLLGTPPPTTDPVQQQPLVYSGEPGSCTVVIADMLGADSCLCYSGSLYAKLSKGAAKSMANQGGGSNRWRCRNVQRIDCDGRMCYSVIAP